MKSPLKAGSASPLARKVQRPNTLKSKVPGSPGASPIAGSRVSKREQVQQLLVAGRERIQQKYQTRKQQVQGFLAYAQKLQERYQEGEDGYGQVGNRLRLLQVQMQKWEEEQASLLEGREQERDERLLRSYETALEQPTPVRARRGYNQDFAKRVGTRDVALMPYASGQADGQASVPPPAEGSHLGKARGPRQTTLHHLIKRVINEEDEGRADWHAEVYNEIFLTDLVEGTPLVREGYEHCPQCNKPMRLAQNSSLLACEHCPRTEPYMDTSSAGMSSCVDVKMSRSEYERKSHFKEWLMYFQARENTKISKANLDAIAAWLVRNRHTDPHYVTPQHVRDAMKDLGMSNLYCHVMQATCTLTGKSPPRLTPNEENILCCLFDKLQKPFQRHKGESRCNFFSYPYLHVQFCLMLGWTHYIPSFKTLRGNDKVRWHDEVFEKCCRDLGLEFTPLEQMIALSSTGAPLA